MRALAGLNDGLLRNTLVSQDIRMLGVNWWIPLVATSAGALLPEAPADPRGRGARRLPEGTCLGH